MTAGEVAYNDTRNTIEREFKMDEVKLEFDIL